MSAHRRARRYSSAIDENRRVIDNTDACRYELWSGGRMAGVVEYRLLAGGDPDVLLVLHVEVLPELRGQGWSEPFFAEVLTEARQRGLVVRPMCGWARRQLRAWPEFHDIVVG